MTLLAAVFSAIAAFGVAGLQGKFQAQEGKAERCTSVEVSAADARRGVYATALLNARDLGLIVNSALHQQRRDGSFPSWFTTARLRERYRPAYSASVTAQLLAPNRQSNVRTGEWDSFEKFERLNFLNSRIYSLGRVLIVLPERPSGDPASNLARLQARLKQHRGILKKFPENLLRDVDPEVQCRGEAG